MEDFADDKENETDKKKGKCVCEKVGRVKQNKCQSQCQSWKGTDVEEGEELGVCKLY